ncbi:MAG: hypothetical protein H6659_05105 [Ardenticatenaceae bacterium]|nr:hypothetical protein [Ardenticatenaceae bacterium]
MNQTTITLGFWTAVGSAATFIFFTFCFVAILLTAPLFVWTNMADFVTYAQGNGRFLQYLAQASMLLFAVLYVILLNSIHELAPTGKKILSRNSLSFGLIFAALSGINYFLQISTVRFYLGRGEFIGLEQILEANPHSAVSAVNMLGITLFFGLSSLFAAPVFSGGRLEKIIRLSFWVNGFSLLLGFVSYLFQWLVVLFVTVNLLMGAAVLVATIGLALWFRRLGKTGAETAVSQPA